MKTCIHHALEVVYVDVARHVRLAETKIGGSEDPDVEQVVVNCDADGISTLFVLSEVVDTMGVCDFEVANFDGIPQEGEDGRPRCVIVRSTEGNRTIEGLSPTKGRDPGCGE